MDGDANRIDGKFKFVLLIISCIDLSHAGGENNTIPVTMILNAVFRV